MYEPRSYAAVVPALIVLTGMGLWVAVSSNTAPPAAEAAEAAPTVADLSTIDLSFEENLGQTDPTVQFMSRGSRATYFLRNTGLVMDIPFMEHEDRDDSQPPGMADPPPVRQIGIHMNLEGSNPEATSEGIGLLPRTTTYRRGKDPSKWQEGVQHYKRVKYHEVYEGVDLVYYSERQELEYDFVVKPGADASQIRFSFEGPAEASLDSEGSLVLSTELGELRHAKPYIYQETGGERRPVAGSYRKVDDDTFTFELAGYNPEVPLVIDPAIVLSSLFGASGFEIIHAVTADLIDPATDLEVFWFGGQVSAGTQLPGPTAKGDIEDVDMFISGVIEVFPEDTPAGLSGEALGGEEELPNIAGTRWIPLGTLIMGGSGRDVLNDLTIVAVSTAVGGSKGPGTSGQRKYLTFGGVTDAIETFPAREITVPGSPQGTGTNRDCGVVGILPEKDNIGDSLDDLEFEIPAPIFADGFESGDVSAWSYTRVDEVKKTPPKGEGGDGDSELNGAKGGLSTSRPHFFTLGTTKPTDTNTDVQVVPWFIAQDRLSPFPSLNFGGPANELANGFDLQSLLDEIELIISFSSVSRSVGGLPNAGPTGTFQAFTAHSKFLQNFTFSDPSFFTLPGQRTTGSTFGGPILYDPDNPDGYLWAANGNVDEPQFSSCVLTVVHTPDGDQITDGEVIRGDDGAVGLQGLVAGLKKDYFICGSSNVPNGNLLPPFELLSPTSGGYDMLWLNCVRGRDGRLSRYYYRWGGRGNDFANACAVDHWGNPILVGYTSGNGFPIVQGAFQSEFAGPPWDGVLVKAKKPLICAITDAASFRPDCIVPGGIISVFGHWVGHRKLTLFRLDSLLRFSTNLFGVEAYILGSDDQRYDCVPIAGFKSQTNLVVNGRVPVGAAKLCLIYKGVRSYYYDITIRPHWPACFTLGQNYGAIVAFPGGEIAGPGVLFPRGGIATAYLTGLGALEEDYDITESSPTDRVINTANDVKVFFREKGSDQDPKSGAQAYGEGLIQGQTLFSGLAPGFTPGLQQVNFTVADDAPLGLVEVLFEVNGTMSDPVLMEVGP